MLQCKYHAAELDSITITITAAKLSTKLKFSRYTSKVEAYNVLMFFTVVYFNVYQVLYVRYA